MSGNQEGTQADGPRTYGNFRKPQSWGLFSFGPIGTSVIFVSIFVLIVLMTFSQLVLAGIWTAAVLVILGLLLARDHHGRTLLQRLGARFGWRLARRRGHNLYRSGPIGRTRMGTCQLPGVLATSALYEFEDSYGRAFAMLEHTSAGHYSIVLACDPDGASLVDPEQVDSWVAHWGQWLATLGQEVGIVSAAVTVETAPDTGARLRRELEGRLIDDAPELAREMLQQVMVQYPAGSATVRAWVTLTVNGKTHSGRKREVGEVARDLASRLPGLTQTLSQTGAGAARPIDALTLCEVVRVAYDPASATILDQVHAENLEPALSWDQVGPSATEASWDSYRHDSAYSRTWMMTTPPRGEVFSSVLARLLSPHPDIDRKRVTILYRPLDAGAAARTVERDKTTAMARVEASPRPSARSTAALAAAHATATEEARGAGLLDFSMLITATVIDEAQMEDARATVDQLAATARILIRPAFGSQDSAFAACLPVGLNLTEFLNIPSEIRSAL